MFPLLENEVETSWTSIKRLLLLLLSLQSCLTLCDPIDGSPPGSPVPGILKAMCCHFLLQCMKGKSDEGEVAQLCLTLSDPMDCSPSGSSIHGIFQARVLEWGTTAFSGGKLLERWKYQTIFLVSWETYKRVKKQQLEPCIEQLSGSRLRKEYGRAVCYHPV